MFWKNNFLCVRYKTRVHYRLHISAIICTVTLQSVICSNSKKVLRHMPLSPFYRLFKN